METRTMTEGVTYALEHSNDGNRWFFGKWLGSDEQDARAEFERVRAFGQGMDTRVQYRAVVRTVERLDW